MKTVILTALTFAILCVVAGVMLVSRPSPPDIAVPAATAARAAPARTAGASQLTAPPEEVSPAAGPVATPTPPNAVPQIAPPPAQARAPGKAARGGQGGGSTKEPLQDPLAREMLAFVGADPIAEEYWFSAINDPDLPAKERQDLIEDLNEDGLSDPKHPGPEDLPLILSRIALIDKLAPSAVDPVNRDALAEAHNDLQTLAGVAAGSGEEVK
jgi:hypothetical protein